MRLNDLEKRIDVLQSYIIRFIGSKKERIENKEIAEGTRCNYIKAIKLFCSMNDIIINWKKISKAIPQANQIAQDRIPTMDEIHKLIQHADRRIKIVTPEELKDLFSIMRSTITLVSLVQNSY